MRALTLRSLQTRAFGQWLKATETCKRLFVATSGYESRSSELMRKVLAQSGRFANDDFLVAGFHDLKEQLSRPANDLFYANAGLDITDCGSSRDSVFINVFRGTLRMLMSAMGADSPLEVHVDYSCMPRNWYCRLPELCEQELREIDTAYFWYTPGFYTNTVYPTAGTSDFEVFSGRASLSARFRTHLFGLGFDRVRSQAIWSVLDPRNLVCFYGDPAINPEYVDRVVADNREVIDAAAFVFTVPLADFAGTFSTIRSTVLQFRQLGDVVIVPDGPKPLVFASSLVPLTLDEWSGVVCFHVSKRKAEGFTPVDVTAAGEAVGFSMGPRGRAGSVGTQKAGG